MRARVGRSSTTPRLHGDHCAGSSPAVRSERRWRRSRRSAFCVRHRLPLGPRSVPPSWQSRGRCVPRFPVPARSFESGRESLPRIRRPPLSAVRLFAQVDAQVVQLASRPGPPLRPHRKGHFKPPGGIWKWLRRAQPLPTSLGGSFRRRRWRRSRRGAFCVSGRQRFRPRSVPPSRQSRGRCVRGFPRTGLSPENG
jgi:hypothetical protein